MHMADALISPAVGGVMWAGAAGAAAYSLKKLHNSLDDKKIPLMGVVGAFVFAAQMINFSIPGTGSSGHIGGGILLAALLGPYAGFLTMFTVLTIQALIFGDGGLLALGCNIFNLGFLTCFAVYPFVKRAISFNVNAEDTAARTKNKRKIFIYTIAAAIIGLQLGSLAVVLETVLSGRTELPFGTFLLFMQPIHLAIGLIEGFITAAVVLFIYKERPEILENAASDNSAIKVPIKKIVLTLIILTVLTGGILSWFASSYPDGLEWSIQKVTGNAELASESKIHDKLADIQDKTALMPDYGADGETGLAGLAGVGFTILIITAAGFAVKGLRKNRNV